MKQCWKYKVVDLSNMHVEDTLNKLGEDGWEAINLTYQDGFKPIVVLKKAYWREDA